MALQLVRRRFTVDEYYRMAEIGILHEDDRIELLDGEIVEMPPNSPAQAGCATALIVLFAPRMGTAFIPSVHHPVRLDEYNEPAPDFALLQPRRDHYRRNHPGPADVLLIVEVGAPSAALDRRIKLPLYARFGIPEVWLVDLARETVRAYRDPAPTGYRTARTYRRGERLAPLAIPDLQLAVAEIVGLD